MVYGRVPLLGEWMGGEGKGGEGEGKGGEGEGRGWEEGALMAPSEFRNLNNT